MGQVFLKRNWDQDKQKITKTFDFLCSNRLPVHLVVFCEGTRINAKNRKEALEFAQQKGIEPMEQVNFPRSRGFKAVANHMRDSHIKYVYDFTIGYLDGTIRFRDLILSSVWGSKVLINVKRIPLSRVPQDDAEIHEWLLDRFRRKDKLIKEMRKNRRFEGEKVLDVPMNFVL
jgi:lysophosphatidic acid acyltransferase/lysophosphatidylinositol acyltransferase